MLRRVLRFLVMPVAAWALLANGAAAEIDAKYLEGVWTIESEKNCGLKEYEHLRFRTNGTFESFRFGVTDSAGFWRHADDVLVLHLVTSPEHFDDKLKEFKGHFDYFFVKVLVFNQQPNKFEGFGLIGDQIKKGALYRCKS